MAAHLAHYQETRFESYGCNQRSVGVSPFSKMPDSVNTDFVSFNYHWLDLLLRPVELILLE